MARQDLLVFAVSVLYIGAIMGGMFGWGASKNWTAEKPIFNPDPERFWEKPDRACNVTDPYAGLGGFWLHVFYFYYCFA